MSLFVALMFASAVTDPQSAVMPQVATPAPVEKKAKEKKICRTDDADVGSHMVRRVCRSAEEWNQQPNYGTGHSGMSISGDKYGQH
jgi:hypothetical protein